ncbi:MAG TPA: hypothetical protein PKJ46_11835, partial [Methanoculleus sp.]|nr:hypothetical protein [Methanoculleus sp.]
PSSTSAISPPQAASGEAWKATLGRSGGRAAHDGRQKTPVVFTENQNRIYDNAGSSVYYR